MKILVLGGTRYFGIHMVRGLLEYGHQVTIATRGQTIDEFGNQVERIIIERTNLESLVDAFIGKFYNVIIDNLAYCSNDVKYIFECGIKCNRYIMISTTAVYNKHIDTKENEFNPKKMVLKWCSRTELPYSEMKRHAEAALFQEYKPQSCVAVRYPFVIGEDDYTKRLYFYVEHIIKGIPMLVDNIESKLGFIRSDEAGKFIAFLVDKEFDGIINGSSYGAISIKQIADYVEKKTGKKVIYSQYGEVAPYNGENEYSINTDLAKSIGFKFSILDDWIFDLLDRLMEKANN